MLYRLLALIVASAGIASCASGPKFDNDRYDRDVTPNQASSAPSVHQDREVLWGGLIVGINNLDSGTEIEVLAYPLDREGAPDDAREPEGRFIARSDDFVEPLEFSPGRYVTVTGALTDSLSGKIGEASYRYPVVATDDLYLWSPARARVRPEVGFGFGFIFGS